MRVKAVPLAVAVEQCLAELADSGCDTTKATITVNVLAPIPNRGDGQATRRITLEEIQRSRE